MTSAMVLGRFRLITQVDACEAAASYTAVADGLSAWVELFAAEVPAAAIQRIKDQRAALAKLKRVRSPEVIEFGEAEHRTFVALRRSPGETLESRIRRGGLGALETLELLIELAEGLAEAHALGIAHGRLDERSIFFAAGDEREELQILGFGLAGLSLGLAEQPRAPDDLRALGRLAWLCLTGPDHEHHEDRENGVPLARALEKQTHLSKEVRELVLRLVEGEGVESASALAELARSARKVVTTDIFPIRPTQRDAAKIEVVLRATIEAANEEDPDDDISISDIDAPHYEGPVRTREPSQPRASPLMSAPAPAPRVPAMDAKTLFIAGAILILLIVGMWIATSSGPTEGVVVESIEAE